MKYEKANGPGSNISSCGKNTWDRSIVGCILYLMEEKEWVGRMENGMAAAAMAMVE